MSGTGSSSFRYEKGSPFFGIEEDEVDDAEFLKPAASSIEERRRQLLQDKEKIEQRTIQSSLRSITLLQESEEIGVQTAQELSQQREQLQNTEQKLDEISSALRISQRHIQGIKSVFGGIKNYFSSPPKKLQSVSESKEARDYGMKSNGDSSNISESLLPSSSSGSNFSSDVPNRTQTTLPRDRSADDILEENLGIMGSSLTRLKGLGLSLQTEIEDQNLMVERIIGKTENTDFKINQQNQQMNKILKK